jgi:cytidine deaminase
VSRGLSGALYFGTNLEFAGEALSFTVHAEQSSVTNAWMNGEEGIDLIAVNAAPCGYCRQFLNELITADRLTVAMPKETRALSELLPSAFGPRDLGVQGGLMQRLLHGLTIDSRDELARAALSAANRSYAPYSKSYAGVALRTAGRRVFTGAYAENAAFNPSMSPLEVALSRLNLAGESFDAIEDAVLVHVDSMHTEATRVVLNAVAKAPLRLVQARNSR